MVSRRLTLSFIHSQALELPLLSVRQFRLRIVFFPAELLGALQGCKGVVGPYSLKVGLAVGRTWRSPRSLHRSRGLRVRRCLRRLAGGGYSRQHQRSHLSENKISHLETSFKSQTNLPS